MGQITQQIRLFANSEAPTSGHASCESAMGLCAAYPLFCLYGALFSCFHMRGCLDTRRRQKLPIALPEDARTRTTSQCFFRHDRNQSTG